MVQQFSFIKKRMVIYLILSHLEMNIIKQSEKMGNKSEGITEPYCFQKRNEIVHKIRLGEDVPIKHKKIKQFTLQNAYDEYIKWAMDNKKSWKNNDQLIYNKHLKEPFGNRSLISLKPQDFEDLKQQKLKEGYKDRTVVLILGIARQTINYAINVRRTAKMSR